MTIHHDKLAYGKLQKLSEQLSEEKLAEMVKALNSEEEKEKTENPSAEKNSGGEH